MDEPLKYTAIFTQSHKVGRNTKTFTGMRWIEQHPGETVHAMVEREQLADNLVFLFHGHQDFVRDAKATKYSELGGL